MTLVIIYDHLLYRGGAIDCGKTINTNSHYTRGAMATPYYVILLYAV